jgi:hypothetical protein
MLRIKKQLALLLLIIILLTPALHKLTDSIPPDWFVGKFEKSLLGIIPGGLTFSYYLIISLELIGPILFMISMLLMFQKKPYQRFLSFGFLSCYFLFIILAFGSFLVQDYDNGFKDFMYFIGVLVIDQLYFSGKDDQ